jgi:hypothetical protein
MKFEPHPYALLLPPLTAAEYAALKTNIERFGILHAVITDQDGLVLDGVHRCRIAAELGIDPPVSQMGQLTRQAKLELAIGVNVRRRHLDPDRRSELVHKLRDEQGLTVREIAAVTGWSKSTVGRDLTPPAPVPDATANGEVSLTELLERWEREHPEPRREDYSSDESDHIAEANYLFACIDHGRARRLFLYREVVNHKNVGEWVADPYGAAFVMKAHAGIRFLTAERKAESIDGTPEDHAEASQAWVAYVAARDGVASLAGEPFGGDRLVQLEDYMYHPAFQRWRDEADAVPDGTR